MNEKEIMVESEILKAIPEEPAMENAVIENGGLSIGKTLAIMGSIGLAAIGAVKLYKFIKKRKAEKNADISENGSNSQVKEEDQDDEA